MARWVLGAALGWLAASAAIAADTKPLQFQVTFTKDVSDKPFAGRVYVVLCRNDRATPPGSLNWFNPEPLFARDVKGWKPGEPLTITDDLAHPYKFDKLPAGKYTAFAMMDLDPGH